MSNMLVLNETHVGSYVAVRQPTNHVDDPSPLDTTVIKIDDRYSETPLVCSRIFLGRLKKSQIKEEFFQQLGFTPERLTFSSSTRFDKTSQIFLKKSQQQPPIQLEKTDNLDFTLFFMILDNAPGMNAKQIRYHLLPPMGSLRDTTIQSFQVNSPFPLLSNHPKFDHPFMLTFSAAIAYSIENHSACSFLGTLVAPNENGEIYKNANQKPYEPITTYPGNHKFDGLSDYLQKIIDKYKIQYVEWKGLKLFHEEKYSACVQLFNKEKEHLTKDCQVALALCYFKGEGVEQSNASAIEILNKLAKKINDPVSTELLWKIKHNRKQ